jgi:hypothetical protein
MLAHTQTDLEQFGVFDQICRVCRLAAGGLCDPQLAAVEEPRVFLTEDESEVRWWVEVGTSAGLRE